MSSGNLQNKIQELASQLALDSATGRYLNTISGNYGLNRPLLGFTDDTWRAATKILALQYKQITNKFRDLIEVVLGPQKTLCTNLLSPAAVGATELRVHDASKLPQTGTVVLDRGAFTEESLSYKLIDYTSNTIFLNDPTTFSHMSVPNDAETMFLGWDTCLSTTEFPSFGFPFVGLLGRGTASERPVTITSNDFVNGLLGTLEEPAVFGVSQTHTTLSRPYSPGSFYLSLLDVSLFPDSGAAILQATNTFTVAGTSSPLAPYDMVTLSVPTFQVNSLSGYRIKFTGNVTSALANKEAYIASNTTNTITYLTLATPAAGDTFYILPVMEYSSKSLEDGALNLKYTVDPVLVLPLGAVIEWLTNTVIVSLGNVQVLGANWDVIQSTPHLVEILVPLTDDQLQNLRTASYLHPVEEVPAGASTQAAYDGDLLLEVVSSADFLSNGTLVIDGGTPDEERVGYSRIVGNTFTLHRALSITHANGVDVEQYQPVHSSTSVLNGDIHGIVPGVFPGPYLYDDSKLAQKSTVITTLNQNVAAPVLLSLGAKAGSGPKALEVESAALFPLSGTFSVQIETEQLTATTVTLAQKTAATLNALATAGATSLVCAAGTLTVAGNGTFPVANGYRALVGRGGANPEIVFVTACNLGTDTLTIQSPGLQFSQASAAKVELLCDVVTVLQIDSDHEGIVSYINRVPTHTANPVPEALVPTHYSTAETVSVLYSSLLLTSGTGFSSTAGKFILNYGGTDYFAKTTGTTSAGASTIALVASNHLPATGWVQVFDGCRHPTIFQMTANNTGTDVITIAGTVKYTIASDTVVTVLGGSTQDMSYDSKTSNTLSFVSPRVVESNHLVGEQVSFSTVMSSPGDQGYDFPLRMPLDTFSSLAFLLDLVRAAGIKVNFIRKR